MSKKLFGFRKTLLAAILKLRFFPPEKVLKKINVYRIMCTFLQKLLKLDVFHHFRTLSDDFFVVSIKKLRRNIFEERNLNCWSLSGFNEKIPTSSTNDFALGFHNCLPPIQMKILRKFSRKDFFFTFGTRREVFWTMREKILAWAKFFSFLAKVFRLACQNWKLFVHLGSFKLLKNSENHRRTTWKTFRIFRLF